MITGLIVGGVIASYAISSLSNFISKYKEDSEDKMKKENEIKLIQNSNEKIKKLKNELKELENIQNELKKAIKNSEGYIKYQILTNETKKKIIEEKKKDLDDQKNRNHKQNKKYSEDLEAIHKLLSEEKEILKNLQLVSEEKNENSKIEMLENEILSLKKEIIDKGKEKLENDNFSVQSDYKKLKELLGSLGSAPGEKALIKDTINLIRVIGQKDKDFDENNSEELEEVLKDTEEILIIIFQSDKKNLIELKQELQTLFIKARKYEEKMKSIDKNKLEKTLKELELEEILKFDEKSIQELKEHLESKNPFDMSELDLSLLKDIKYMLKVKEIS